MTEHHQPTLMRPAPAELAAHRPGTMHLDDADRRMILSALRFHAARGTDYEQRVSTYLADLLVTHDVVLIEHQDTDERTTP